MNAKNKQRILDTIENEGFDYCFINYSNFEDIKDKEFHRLRQAYLDDHKALADYIGLE